MGVVGAAAGVAVGGMWEAEGDLCWGGAVTPPARPTTFRDVNRVVIDVNNHDWRIVALGSLSDRAEPMFEGVLRRVVRSVELGEGRGNET